MRELTMRERLRLSGIMPANLLPFTADLAIDEPAYRNHLRWLADTRGVTGIGYSPETLARLAEIPHVCAVKDWSNDIVAFEANLRALRATGRPVAMLSAFTMSLMATFLLGADGAISGMGSVVADLQAELFEACQKGDVDGARWINDRLDPLVRVFYAPPFVDMHNRMKEALVLLGRIPAAHVRPPLPPVSATERAALLAACPAPDILVNNAGGPPPGDFREWDRDTWIKALDANMITPILLIKATVDGMIARRFGRIVNITSSAVKHPIDILGLSNG